MSSQVEIANILSPTPIGVTVVPDFEEPVPPSSLAATPELGDAFSSLTTQGGVYLALWYGLGVVISIGNMFVLTWWIGPHAYGIFITAIGLTAFLASLTRSGVDTYLVRCTTVPTERMYHIASTIITGFSVLLLALGVAAVPLLSWWYASREFVPAYLAMLLTIPLVGLAGPPTAKLERSLNFRVVAQIELSGQLLALVVSLTLAWQGTGVWAPVIGVLVWQMFAVIGACRAAKLFPWVQFDTATAREMLSFGVGYTASLRAWQLRTLVNPLLVGRFLGTEAVAFVGLAIRIAEGLGFVRIAAARLAIAALARLQEDKDRFRAALEKALQIQVLVLGPLLCGFALFGPFVVGRFMGTRWTPTLQVYPFIAAGVLVNSVFNLQASALFVVGQQWVVLKAYASHVALLSIGTFLLIPRFGVAGYGWADGRRLPRISVSSGRIVTSNWHLLPQTLAVGFCLHRSTVRKPSEGCLVNRLPATPGWNRGGRDSQLAERARLVQPTTSRNHCWYRSQEEASAYFCHENSAARLGLPEWGSSI